MTQTSLHSATERKIVFKRIIHTKAVQFEGRKRPFSSHACSSLGVVVRLPTETLNFLFQNKELINLISLEEESVTFLIYLTNGRVMHFQRRHRQTVAIFNAACSISPTHSSVVLWCARKLQYIYSACLWIIFWGTFSNSFASFIIGIKDLTGWVRKSLLLLGFNSRTDQPIGSPYTDYAVEATQCL